MSCATCSNGNGTPKGCKNNGHCATGGCGKLEVFDWLAGVSLPSGQKPFNAVEVRFKSTRKGFYRCTSDQHLTAGDAIVVEAASGVDVGTVSLTGELVRVQMNRKNGSTDIMDLKKVVRKAEQDDLDRWHEVRGKEHETMLAARRIVHQKGMEMKIGDVEFQGDGSRATFYYTAEERVDFRSVVRELADECKARVEMKQLGSRQEAGRLGGIGSCGRELCCSTWLTDLRSVTTKAARYQDLSLNAEKLAGQCGKLKCCINYELDTYVEAVNDFPKKTLKLKTTEGNAAHTKTDIFKRKMFYYLKTERGPMMIGLDVEKVKEIIELNREGELVDLTNYQEAPAPKPKHDYDNVVGDDDVTRFDEVLKKKSNGRGRNKGKGGGDRRKKGGQQAKGAGRSQKRPAASKEGADKQDPPKKSSRRKGRGRGPRPADKQTPPKE